MPVAPPIIMLINLDINPPIVGAVGISQFIHSESPSIVAAQSIQNIGGRAFIYSK